MKACVLLTILYIRMQGEKLADKGLLARISAKIKPQKVFQSIINGIHGPIKARKSRAGDINSWLTMLLYLTHYENKKRPKTIPPKLECHEHKRKYQRSFSD